MPFGLTNAPATFMRTMNHIFRDYLDRFVVVFLDDILVYSRNPEEHCQHLQTVFKLLADNRLFINRDKSVFFQPRVEYLGHIIDRDGLHVDPRKVQAINDWPIPQNITQLRAFLGLANFSRKFVQDFSKKVAPLTDLTKDKVFTWTDQAQAAFTMIKSELASTHALSFPDPASPYSLKICTDASNQGLGAVLLQGDKVIAYESRKLKPRERIYPVHDKELLAIHHALQTWRHFLLGQSFEVHTDHRSLRYLFTQEHLNDRQRRWIEHFADFHFQINYAPGKLNVIADALSRTPLVATVTTVDFPLVSEFSGAYPLDPDFRHLWTALQQNQTTSQQLLAAGYRLEAGLLIRWNRICVPRQFQLTLFQECHETPTGGHLGRDKTLHTLSQHFYWKGMATFVAKQCRQCLSCQAAKIPTTPPSGLLQPLPVPHRPWEHITMDFITGLPKYQAKYDGIMTVVDRFTKLAHFIPYRTNMRASDVAKLFLQHIIRLHGVPASIVSDRDTKFLSEFWKDLMAALGTQLNFSTAFHPQTDGQSEVLNRIVEDILRCFVHETPGKWGEFLPLAEYAYNSSKNSSTGLTPFFATYGYQPRLPLDIARAQTVPIHDTLLSWQQIFDHLYRMITASQQKYKHTADLHRKPTAVTIGSWVWLRLHRTRFQHKQFSKLQARYFGPFKVLKQIGTNAFRLQLPPSWTIHNVFHASLLKLHQGDPPTADDEPVALPDTPFQHTILKPIRILAHEWRVTRHQRYRRFKVLWDGLDPDHCTWETEHDLQDYGNLVADYDTQQLAIAHLQLRTTASPGGEAYDTDSIIDPQSTQVNTLSVNQACQHTTNDQSTGSKSAANIGFANGRPESGNQIR